MYSLCIDEGNSRLKFALFASNKLIAEGGDMLALELLDFTKVNHSIVATVLAPSPAIDFLTSKGIPYHRLTSKSNLPFKNSYATPYTVGADRLAAAAAAVLNHTNHNTLVITIGTCITYNFINKDNEFIGGSISPGIQMRLNAMHHFTSRLPFTEWEYGKSIPLVANSTQESMRSGAINGVAAEVAQTINWYAERFENLNTMATGGDASFLVSQFKNNIFADPQLLLKGLNHILSYNAV
jgi:type III pantothenate kinase